MLLKKSVNKILILILTACISTVALTVGLRAIFPRKHYNYIASICKETAISPNLVLAIIKAESSYSGDKVSNKGAVGLMQIMPNTANYVSDLFFAGERFNLYDEKDNILIGVTYLIYLSNKFDNKKTVLSAYNAGEGRVYDWLNCKDYSIDGKSLDNIPFEETKIYVEKVLKYEKIYGYVYKQ